MTIYIDTTDSDLAKQKLPEPHLYLEPVTGDALPRTWKEMDKLIDAAALTYGSNLLATGYSEATLFLANAMSKRFCPVHGGLVIRKLFKDKNKLFEGMEGVCLCNACLAVRVEANGCTPLIIIDTEVVGVVQ